jgi:hypothetical protein
MSKSNTGLVIIDPHIDFLSEKGVVWDLVGDSVKENNSIENIERLFKAAKKNGFEVSSRPLLLPHRSPLAVRRNC